MKLSEFLIESLSLNEAFTNRSSISEWSNNLNGTYKQYKQEIIKLLDGFFGSSQPDHILISPNPKECYFKISYDYDNLCEKYKNGFKIEGVRGCLVFKFEYGRKWNCYYILDKIKLHIFQLGSGSEGKIDTKTQESALASIWNNMVDGLLKNIINPDMDNDEFLAYINSTGNADSLNESWKKSIVFEVQCIKNYIKSLGVNVEDYKIDRYGDGKVGKAYAQFIQNYALKAQKDTIDPSDVILYKTDDIDKISSDLNNLSKGITFENRLDFREKFVTDLWGKTRVRGISLKKMSKDSTAEEFNTGEHLDKFKVDKIINYHVADKGINLIVGGSFDFCNSVDSQGNIIKCKELQISLRSFGKYLGCDVKSITRGNNKTPLGKCSVTVWRDNILNRLNITIKDCKNEKQKVLAKFLQMLKNSNIPGDGEIDVNWGTDKPVIDSDIKITLKDVTNIIRSAIKDGPESIPFVLVH